MIYLDELKKHLGIFHDLDDERLELLLDDAITTIEEATDRSIKTKTLWRIMPSFPKCFEIPKPPLKKIVRIEYYDTNNELQILPDTQWSTYQTSPDLPPWIWFMQPPQVATRPDAVKIVWQAGGFDKARRAILAVADFLNENRGVPDAKHLPGLDRVLREHRLGGYV